MKEIKKFGFIGGLLVMLIAGFYEEDINIGQFAGKTTENVSAEVTQVNLEDYKLVEVKPCDLSGNRQANVVVDIGYDSDYANRDYYGFTNELGQLFYVHADEIILQNDEEENNGDDRYCRDEAKVDGVEADDLDEGHVIADSLGGVSNAYNITPQDSNLNRHGTQADLEEEMREALASGKSVTDFNADITYSDESMTPSSYQITYLINGKQKSYSFDNK